MIRDIGFRFPPFVLLGLCFDAIGSERGQELDIELSRIVAA